VSSREWTTTSTDRQKVGIVRIKFFSSATADDVREKVASLLKGGGGSSGKSSGKGGEPQPSEDRFSKMKSKSKAASSKKKSN
jgi:hypothetical protein